MKLYLQWLSVVMAILILFSSTGIVVSKHLCEGELMDVAWFTTAEPCEHSSAATTMQCPVHEGMIIHPDNQNNDCCEDTKDLVKDENPQMNVKDRIEGNNQPVVVLLVNFLININTSFNLSSGNLLANNLHVPPLIDQDIPVMYQSFLL